MAWEWVAPTASSAVAIVGMALAWFSGKSTQEHSERIHTSQLNHERLKATEERTQTRLAETYTELLTMAEKVGQWANTVRPLLDTNPPQPVPPLPELVEQARVRALVGAFGSASVRQMMQEWTAVVQEMISTHELIDLEAADEQHGRPRPEGLPNLYMKMHDLRPKERKARDALAYRVGTELGHRPVPSGGDRDE